MLRWASWWAQAAYGRVRHCPGSLVPAIGSRPPENLAKRNSTWPPENSTWLKDTWAPENSVPAQETITRDNVTLKVDAVVYYRVVDPLKAIINVQNYHFVVSQVAQTSLRGRSPGAATWTSCCPNGSRSTPSSRTSSTPRPKVPGASAWSAWRSRTSPCPNP